MPIVEEPFSIWRALGSLFKGRAMGDRPGQPGNGDDEALSDPLSRGQLIEARQKIQHQIELLEHGARSPSHDPMLIANLKQTLDQIEADLQDEPEQLDEWTEADDAETDEVASLGDPSTLSRFNVTVTNIATTQSDAVWVEYLLVCKNCVGGDMFSIVSYPEVVPDPSPYDGVAPGSTVHLAPYSARCIECGHEELVFDPQKDGREAVLHGASDRARTPDEPTDESGVATLYVALIYRAKLVDLKDQATQANVAPADLFDAIHVRGVSPSGDTIFEEQSACA